MKLRATVAVAIAALYVFLAYLNYWPGNVWGRPKGFELAKPTLTSGDEPHYMLIIHSLLFDHDARLDNNFRNVRDGGYDAGSAFRNAPDFGGHSLLIDPKTGQHILCIVRCEDADVAKLGGWHDDFFQVPSHPFAYAAFMALLAWPFHPAPADVEGLVGIFSGLVAAACLILTYACARKCGFSTKQAAMAAVLGNVASPCLVYIHSYFSDSSIGLFLLLGFLALRSKRPILAGVGVAVATAMKPVFVLVAFAWIAERLLAKRMREAILLTASAGGCGVLTLVINMLAIHVPYVGGALPLGFANGPKSAWETFFDREHGLFVFVPWTIPAFFWGIASLRRLHDTGDGMLPTDARRQIMVPILLCIATFCALPFGPGWCVGPRYYIPLFPFFGLLAIDLVAVKKEVWTKPVVGFLSAVAAVIAITSLPQYHWIFSRPPFDPIIGP